MAANGVEIASVYVSVLAKMPGVAKSINSAIGSVDTSAAGKRIGQDLAASVGKSLKDQVAKKFADETAAALDKSTTATKKLEDAEHSLLKARAQHGTATAKVTAAEERLDKLRASGKASTADLEAAEARLARAQADSTGTSRGVAAAKNSVAEATRNATDASKEYSSAMEAEQSKAARSQEWTKLAVARVGDLSDRWKSAGSQIQGVGEQLASKFTKPVAIAGGAVATLVGALGFKRLVGIDTARGQFQGLGMDADAVMKQVDKGVTDTSLSMATGASLAVGILATGAVPLEGLEAQIKRVANVSAAYNVDGEHAAYLLNNVLSKNKVTYGDLSQMVQNQIPIITQLGEHYGVTGDEIQKMANSGEISIETLNEVLDNNAGAAAESYANTWKGVTSNILSNVGKIGAKFLEPTFGVMKEEAAGFLDMLRSDDFSSLATEFGATLGETVKRVSEGVQDLISWWVQLSPGMKKTIGIAAGLAVAIGPVLIVVGKMATGIGAVLGVVRLIIPAVVAFNAVLAANPIMLIVLAVAALVAGILYWVTQTESGQAAWAAFTGFLSEAWANVSAFFQTVWESVLKPVFDAIGTVATWLFENILLPAFLVVRLAFAILGGIFQGIWDAILKPIFTAFGAIAKWLWDTILKVVFLAIKLQVQVLGAIFSWLWTTIIKPVFGFIGNLIRSVWVGFIQPVFTAIWNVLKNTLGPVFTWLYNTIIKPVWDGIKNTIKNVWTNGIKPVIDTLVKVMKNDPGKAFEAARDAIGDAWKGIQELAKKPVKFVVNTVINGLIGAINKIPGVNIPKVALPKGFARGGILPGMSRMSDGDDQLIMARRGEGMMVSEALRTSADRSAFLAANAAGRSGVGFASMLQGLARGGLVDPLPAGSWSVAQQYHGGHNGIDLAAASGTPVFAAASGTVGLAGSVPMGGNEVYVQHANGLGTRYSHLSRFASQAGQQIRQGQRIGYVGSTGMSTGPHLHYMVHNPGGGAGMYGNHVNPAPYMGLQGKDQGEGWNPLSGLIDWAADKIKGAFPEGGMWVDAAAGLAKDAAKNVIDVFTPKWGTDQGSTLYDSGGWLPTGKSLVENRSGRPEPILTAGQWDSLLDSRSGGSGGTFHLYDSDGVLFGTMRGIAEDAVDQGIEDAASERRRFASV